MTPSLFCKLSADLSTLLASTYLGGTGYEQGVSLALVSRGNVFVTGTISYNANESFPVQPTAYSSPPHDSGWNIIVSKFSPDLDQLLASTYLGGTGVERGRSIVVDRTGNVYIAASSDSWDFPTTKGAFGRSYSGIGGESVIVKFSPDLTNNYIALPPYFLLMKK